MRTKLFFILCILLIPAVALCQTINADSVLAIIRSDAAQEDYTSALKKLQTLIDHEPANKDYKVYKGRILSWQKNYAEAASVLQPMADENPPHRDATEALINVYVWSGQYGEALVLTERYLQDYPNTESVMLSRLIVLEKMNRDADAVVLADSILKINPSSKGAIGMQTLIARKKANLVTLSYLNISFHNPSQPAWHFAFLEYAVNMAKSSFAARATAGYVRNQVEPQIEIDYYRKFPGREYLLLTIGVSNGRFIFPVLRAGIDYYSSPVKRFDFSAGFRYYHFRPLDAALLTAESGIRFQQNRLAYRMYFEITNALFSHVVSYENTNDARERWLRLELQYGTVPYLYTFNNVVTPLYAYRAGIQYKFRIGNSLFMRPIVLYEYEQYLPSLYRNKLNLQLMITKRF